MASAVLSSLYHSGVGWFSDILEMEVFVDTEVETYSAVPRHTRVNPVPPEERGVPLFANKQHRIPGEDNDGGEGEGEDDEDEDGGNGSNGLTAEDLARSSDGRYTSHLLPLVPGGVPVCGFVRITAPAGRSIPHSGISASLVSNLFALDDHASKELYSEEVTLCGDGELQGSVDLPFVFLGTAEEPLPDSFEGGLFSVRHRIKVEVLRPWYTYPVTEETPLGLQSVHRLPPRPAAAVTAAAAEEEFSGANQEEPLVPTVPIAPSLVADATVFGPQRMALEGLDDGAEVALELERGCYELSSTLRGQIVCRGLRTPLLLLKLAVVRVEFSGGQASDTVIFDDAIMDARNWRVRRDRRRAFERLRDERAREAAQAELAAADEAAAEAAEAVAAAEAAVDSTAAGAGAESVASAPADAPLTSAPEDEVVAESSGAEGAANAEEGSEGDGGDEEGGEEEEEEEEDDGAEWVADPDEYEAAEPDPDLPIVGDVSLSVDLDLSQLKVTPTYLIDVGAEGRADAAAEVLADAGAAARKAAAAAAAKAAKAEARAARFAARASAAAAAREAAAAGHHEAIDAGDSDADAMADADEDVADDADLATVRYFMRLTVYTAFNAEARRWNAKEVVLYRGRLYGQEVPAFRLPSSGPAVEVSAAFKNGTAGVSGGLPSFSLISGRSRGGGAGGDGEGGDGESGSASGSSGGSRSRRGVSMPSPLTGITVSDESFAVDAGGDHRRAARGGTLPSPFRGSAAGVAGVISGDSHLSDLVTRTVSADSGAQLQQQAQSQAARAGGRFAASAPTLSEDEVRAMRSGRGTSSA